AAWGMGAEARAGGAGAGVAGGDVAREEAGPSADRYQRGGEAVLSLGELPDGAAAGADGGEFGGHVHGVDQDQRRDDEDGCEGQRLQYFAGFATLSRVVSESESGTTRHPTLTRVQGVTRLRLQQVGNKTESVGVLPVDE